MGGILTLLLLSLAMLVGCYVAGIIPLAITLSEEKLKLVTVLGAGLLVGTALAVIIPEGVHVMYMADATGHESHDHIVIDVKKNTEEAIKKEHETSHKDIQGHGHEHDQGHDHEHDQGHGHEHEQGPGHEHGMAEAHSIIGVTLVAGFVFMLLVDQIGGNVHMHGPADTENGEETLVQKNRNKITVTLGLVVHAAADGIALGAAVTMSAAHITMIIFVAIMLHKAPAAFGLVSFLLHEGFDRPRIRRHLLIFSLAAPLLAMITYFTLTQNSLQKLNDLHTTGIAMLFSAGTFLYVATVHVLPEIAMAQSKHTSPDGTILIHEHKGFRCIELAALVTGAIIPVILSIGHKH